MGPIALDGTRCPRLPPSSPAAASFPYARSRMFATDFACHCPPRAVGTPRAFSAAAISLRDVAPAFCASRMMGRTLAATVSLGCYGLHSALAGLMKPWVAQGDPTGLRGR